MKPKMIRQRGQCPKEIPRSQLSSMEIPGPGPNQCTKDNTGPSEYPTQIAGPTPCPIEIPGPGPSQSPIEIPGPGPSQCPIEIPGSQPSHLDCTLQLCDMKTDSPVPLHQPTYRAREHHAIVSIREASRNCKLCYKLFKKEMRTQFYCKYCDQSYCLNSRRNCMLKAHLTSPN